MSRKKIWFIRLHIQGFEEQVWRSSSGSSPPTSTVIIFYQICTVCSSTSGSSPSFLEMMLLLPTAAVKAVSRREKYGSPNAVNIMCRDNTSTSLRIRHTLKRSIKLRQWSHLFCCYHPRRTRWAGLIQICRNISIKMSRWNCSSEETLKRRLHMIKCQSIIWFAFPKITAADWIVLCWQ